MCDIYLLVGLLSTMVTLDGGVTLDGHFCP